MKALVERIVGRKSSAPASQPLGGFIDSLLQTFEDCRPGLSDEVIAAGAASAEQFFTAIYEKERKHLESEVALHEIVLEENDRRAMLAKVDDLVRQLVIPAYARLALEFSRRERNGFYIARESLRGLERALWCAGGMLLGAFVVWAPFVPLWSKEWVLPFAVAGVFFPEIRRYLAIRGYEAEVNRIVDKANRQIEKTELAFLTSPEPAARHARPAHRAEGGPRAETQPPETVPPPETRERQR